MNFDTLSEDYQRIEAAILYLEKNYQRQPSLKEIASHVGLSEYHFQRVFTRWAGISPKRFLQFLTKENAKQILRRSANILDTTYQVGLSSTGRLHDLFVSCEAVTPGEYKQQGRGLTIHYGFHATPFGDCLLAVTERGICGLSFIVEGRQSALANLQSRWQQASLLENSALTKPYINHIFGQKRPQAQALTLLLNGTNFQIKVWEALLHIPPGAMVTYQRVAQVVGNPRAVRAVGSAVARNPIAVLIPCHRVIRKLGEFGKYRYGTARKMALLGREFISTEI
jgi:AraC family transcriptional regulator of adaptative response/methylated-DNA-[protein]-cysteine methyltransferase